MSESEPASDPGLARAYALISVFSEVVVRIMAEELGHASTANRTTQALMVVHADPGVTPSELARRAGMTRSATARAVAHLMQEQLVRRVPDPRDRRSARLHPTAQSRERLEAFEAAFGEYLVATADASREIVGLLDPHAGTPAGAPAPASGVGTASDVLVQMTRAGVAFVDRVRIFTGTYSLDRGVDRAALALILDRGSLRPSALETDLRVSSGGATKVLHRLEEAGLVRRHRPAPGEDGRIVRVKCTPRGLEAMAMILDVLRGQAFEMAAAFAAAVGYADAASSVGRSGAPV